MWWVDGCSRESKLDFPASRRICFAMSHQPETVVTGLAEWARQSKPEAGMRRSPGEPAAALEVGLGTMAHHWRAKIPPPSPVHGWKNSRGPQFAGELEEHFVRIRILTFPAPPGAFVRLGEPGARLRAASSATEKVRGRRRRPSSGAVAKPSPWRRWTCLMASLPGNAPCCGLPLAAAAHLLTVGFKAILVFRSSGLTRRQGSCECSVDSHVWGAISKQNSSRLVT
jgi:hypothetical protein